MFLKYVTTATPTIAQVIADLAALASGASISSLSLSCDKVNSQIIANTDAPGWTLADAAGPSSSRVLTAKDASNVDKYLALVPTGTTAIYSSIFDTYNATTHTATNFVAANSQLAFSTTQVNTYFMLVNQKHLIISDTIGSITIGSIEFSREIDFLSNPAYPAHANIGYNGSVQQALTFAKMKKQNGSGDVLAGAGGQNVGGLMTISMFNGSAIPQAPYRDAGDAQYLPMLPFYIGANIASYGSVPFGKVDDAYLTAMYGAAYDTVLIGADTYVVILISGGRVLFKMA